MFDDLAAGTRRHPTRKIVGNGSVVLDTGRSPARERASDGRSVDCARWHDGPSRPCLRRSSLRSSAGGSPIRDDLPIAATSPSEARWPARATARPWPSRARSAVRAQCGGHAERVCWRVMPSGMRRERKQLEAPCGGRRLARGPPSARHNQPDSDAGRPGARFHSAAPSTPAKTMRADFDLAC